MKAVKCERGDSVNREEGASHGAVDVGVTKSTQAFVTLSSGAGASAPAVTCSLPTLGGSLLRDYPVEDVFTPGP